MIESGKVVDKDEERVCIETQRKTPCHSCHSESCGVGVVNRMFSNKPNRFWLKNPGNMQIGSSVDVELGKFSLIKASVLIYAIPLLSLVACGLLGRLIDNILGLFEVFTILLAVSGFALSFFVVRAVLQRRALDMNKLVKLRISHPED